MSDDDGIVVGVFYTYILRCADGAVYVGHAEDLDARIAMHNDGRAALFTRRRRPVRIAYAEPHPTQRSAIVRERQIKRWTRGKKEALLANDSQLLEAL